jgi:signal transduction histidine kinase
MQVFQNLISNAVKYMDKPTGEIRIAATEDESCWTFSVADNGPGIEEKYFDRIFQMFQTLAPSNGGESTGIGLAVVKKIVQMHGGAVWVRSRPGRGSTFFFTLPKPNEGTTHEMHPTRVVG